MSIDGDNGDFGWAPLCLAQLNKGLEKPTRTGVQGGLWILKWEKSIKSESFWEG